MLRLPGKGAFRLPIKSAGMGKFPWWLGHAMLSGRFRRERFTAVPRRGGKGDKSVIPLARSRRWAVFIAIFICHGEEANGIFLHSVYWCAKTKVWMAFTVYRLSRFDAVIVVWMRPKEPVVSWCGMRCKEWRQVQQNTVFSSSKNTADVKARSIIE